LGQTYSYRVIAFNVAGDGPASNTVTSIGGLTVSTVNTTTATGAYNAGKTITITIGFTGPVNVTGFPQLALNNGVIVNYASGGGTNTLTFNYLVAPGQDIARLDFSGTTALSGTITDPTSGQAVALILPTPASISDKLWAANIRIDTIPPMITGSLVPAGPANTGWYNSSTGAPVYSYTASDSGSGLASTSPANGSYTFPEGANQTHTFTVADQAGNTASVTSTVVNVDLTSPVTTAAVTAGTAGTNGWYTSSSVTVSLTPNDIVSGVQSTLWSLDGKTWTAGTSVMVSAQGTTTVSYYSTDKAGNTEATKTFIVKIDSVAPAVTAPNITVGPTDSTGATVSYSSNGFLATDATSGLAGPVTFNPPDNSHFLAGNTTVAYTATDFAGNTTSGSFTVTVNPAGFIGTVLYIVGTSANQTFVIDATSSAAVSVTINGTVVPNSPFNLSGGQTISAFGDGGTDSFTISGAVGAVLNGTGGTNTFTVNGYTGTGTLTGGGSDTVKATKTTGNITLTNSLLMADDGLHLGLSGITSDSLALSNYTGSTSVVDASAFTGTSTLTASSTTSAYRVKLLGGSGNDTLTVNGSGQAALVGNAGNDTLNANGSGRTILIGGAGADTLTAGASAQSIMIGESTSYDNNMAALDAILNEWSSGNNYQTRINNILGGTGALSGTGFALTSSTVIQDGALDTLTGPTSGGSAQNWFIKKSGSKGSTITKRNSEVITTL
jgi:hypothetical protein